MRFSYLDVEEKKELLRICTRDFARKRVSENWRLVSMEEYIWEYYHLAFHEEIEFNLWIMTANEEEILEFAKENQIFDAVFISKTLSPIEKQEPEELKQEWTIQEIDEIVSDQKKLGYEYYFFAKAIKNSDFIIVNDRMMSPDVAKHFYTVINRHRPGRESYYANRLPSKPKNEYDRGYYKKYVSTKEWRAKRRAIFERDNYRCVKCSSNKRLCCHHLTYDNLGDEPLSDLQTLCTSCHAKLHWIEAIGEKRESGGF